MDDVGSRARGQRSTQSVSSTDKEETPRSFKTGMATATFQTTDYVDNELMTRT